MTIKFEDLLHELFGFHERLVALFFETTKRCQVTGIVLSRLRTGGEEGKGVLAATLKPLREESKRESGNCPKRLSS